MLRKVDPALAHRLFYPGVSAILSARLGKTVAAMPVISYSALSENPPLFGVSCAKDSYTLQVASAAKAFSLCLVGEDRAKAITLLASRRGEEGSDKLAKAGLAHKKGSRLGAPIIFGSAAVLECSLQQRLVTGDHVLLVGRIEAALATGDFRSYWRFKSYHPLLYVGWQRGVKLYRPATRRTR